MERGGVELVIQNPKDPLNLSILKNIKIEVRPPKENMKLNIL
jgi:hypothetical protein